MNVSLVTHAAGFAIFAMVALRLHPSIRSHPIVSRSLFLFLFSSLSRQRFVLERDWQPTVPRTTADE
jgi:hypothetical protein